MPLAQCQLIREMKKLLLSGELDAKTQEVEDSGEWIDFSELSGLVLSRDI